MFKTRALGRRDVAGLIFVLACGLQLAACSTKKDALVIFDVKTAADVPAFTQLRFSVPGNASVPAESTAETSANRSEFTVGYYVPVGGSLIVLGEALTADKCVVGRGMANVSGIVLGQVTPGTVTLSIAALATPLCPTDGGSVGAGGGGGAADGSADAGAGRDTGAAGSGATT